jgi:hypothetical protein
MNRRRAFLFSAFAVGAAIGSLLAIPFYAFLRSSGVDSLIAVPLAAMAFFFAFALESTILRIAFGFTHLWRNRR